MTLDRVISTVEKATEVEAKEKLQIAAFIGWQMGAGGKKSLREYMRSLGLLEEKTQITKGQIKLEKNIALQTAAKIIEFDKKRRESLKRNGI